MPRWRRRPTELLLKLEVVMEEDLSLSADLDCVTDDHPSQHRQLAQQSTTRAVTLRSSGSSNGSEPQFLHGNRWPSVNTGDEMVGSPARSAGDRSPIGAHASPGSANHQVIPCGASNSVVTNTWQAVMPDDLSMAVDHWDPDEHRYPCLSAPAMDKSRSSTTEATGRSSGVANQQRLFLREIMDEYLTRLQTVEHIEELDDNDDAIEVVATLEQYRQNGWADEMVRAFPGECYQFWVSSGLNVNKKGEDVFEGFDSVVLEDGAGTEGADDV